MYDPRKNLSESTLLEGAFTLMGDMIGRGMSRAVYELAVAKSLVGRQGVNSTTVITGDINQKDLKSYSGLELLLEVSKYGNIDLKVIDFDSWDYCVRSEESKAWGMAFEKYELQKGRVKQYNIQQSSDCFIF